MLSKLTLSLTLLALPAKPAYGDLASYIAYLNPSSDSNRLSILLNKYGTKYKVDPYLLAAIAMQESSLRPHTIGYKNGKAYDFGLLQLNLHTLPLLNMTPADIYDDHLYLDRAVAFFKHKMDTCIRRPKWVCWHTANEKQGKLYYSLVQRYYSKADKFRIKKPNRKKQYSSIHRLYLESIKK